MKKFLFVLSILFMTFSAHSHKTKSAMSTVLFNENSGYLEVVHRFVLHDVEHATGQLFNTQSDFINNEKSQQQFASYVSQTFQLQNSDKQKLHLTLVGQEVQDGYVWVYQEITLPKRLSGLRVKQNVLHEVWPQQINQVNIETQGVIQSLLFSANSQWQHVTLPSKHNE